MNLDYSLINVVSIVIECLLERGSYPLNKVLEFAKSSHNDINEQDITLAVSFLFLLGKVNYNKELDLVHMCGHQND